MAEVRWHVLTIGHLSRNKFWGESDDQAYRAPLCTSTLIKLGDRTIVVDPGCAPNEMAHVLHQRTGLRPEAVDTVFLTHFHGDHRVGITAFPQARWCMAAYEIQAWTAQVAPDWQVPDKLDTMSRVIQRGLQLKAGAMAKPISKEIKDEIITKIKTEGISGAEAARRYGVNVKNIYRWLADGVGGTSSQTLEFNRLKRENQQLKQLIGQLLLDQERGKKD